MATTFLSRSYFTGDGVNQVFPINWPSGFAHEDHVEVYIDGERQPAISYTVGDSPAQVTFLLAPPLDGSIILKRRTPKTYPADFSQPVVIKSSNLQKDLDYIQLWAEESDDLMTITDPQSSTGIDPEGYLTYQEMVDYVNAVLAGVTDPTEGDTIIVQEYGRFYKQVSGVGVGQTVFNLLFSYTQNSFTMAVYLNGELQVQDLDYEETTNLSITMLTPLVEGVDTLQFVWSKTITAIPTNVYTDRTTIIKTNVAGEDTFQIVYDPGNIDVVLNGIKLVRTVDFTAIDGANVILTEPLLHADDIIEIIAYSVFTIANHYTKAEVYPRDAVYSRVETYSNDETYSKAEVDALIAGSSQAVFVGSIIGNPMNTIKTGYLECNGQAINRTTYAALFAELGETYGVGNGINTFNIPDYRGEFLRGWDNGRGVDVGRNLGSLQGDTLGAHKHRLANADVVGVGSQLDLVPEGQLTTRLETGGSGNTRLGGSNTPATIGWSGTTGDNETRPRNMSIMWLIKY